MARRKGSRSTTSERSLAERVEWISEQLDEYSVGIHRLGQPAMLLDSELPAAVEAVYREFNGAELFHESLFLFPSTRVSRANGMFLVAECGGDDIFVDARGAVWRQDTETEELLPEGTRFDRWLAGAVDAESVIYDKEGEFRDDIFDEEGELTDDAEAERARRQLKRDPKAIAPRWRLARALVTAGKAVAARAYLEEVVAAHPDFPWAWFDLARISEELGEPELASEEAQQAGEVRENYEHAAFFLAHAARLAEVAGQDERSRTLAAEVLRRNPDLPRNHVEAARECLEADDAGAARELLLLAKVVAPRDLQVLDLLAQLQN